jgi:hypothetical protein
VRRGRDTRYVSQRERIKGGYCPADVTRASLADPGRDYTHECTLAAGHLGMHLCWCGSAFNDMGEAFAQKRLPSFD